VKVGGVHCFLPAALQGACLGDGGCSARPYTAAASLQCAIAAHSLPAPNQRLCLEPPCHSAPHYSILIRTITDHLLPLYTATLLFTSQPLCLLSHLATQLPRCLLVSRYLSYPTLPHSRQATKPPTHQPTQPPTHRSCLPWATSLIPHVCTVCFAGSDGNRFLVLHPCFWRRPQ